SLASNSESDCKGPSGFGFRPENHLSADFSLRNMAQETQRLCY
ncbi:hypothetical protein JMJ77_0012802, partial [Colletotrichum scovillei]